MSRERERLLRRHGGRNPGGGSAVLGALTGMEPAVATILLVEDHGTTRAFLADNLSADGFRVIWAESVLDALRLIETEFPDLVLVDLGLADGDGLELLREVRRADRLAGSIDPELPLLVLTGRAGELDRLRAFERGCDDYVTKPFSYHELRARVSALLRRTSRRPKCGRVRVGALEVDPVARRVRLDGEPIELSPKEFALLRTLAAEPTRTFTRDELLKGVWGFRAQGATRTIDSHVLRLRRKLNTNGEHFIVNVWGIGYRLVDGALE